MMSKPDSEVALPKDDDGTKLQKTGKRAQQKPPASSDGFANKNTTTSKPARTPTKSSKQL